MKTKTAPTFKTISFFTAFVFLTSQIVFAEEFQPISPELQIQPAQSVEQNPDAQNSSFDFSDPSALFFTENALDSLSVPSNVEDVSLDDFNRSSPGTNWSATKGIWKTQFDAATQQGHLYMEKAASGLSCSKSDPGYLVMSTPPSSYDYLAEADFTFENPQGTRQRGILARFQDANNFYYGEYSISESKYRIIKVDDGKWTTLAETSAPVVISGSTHKIGLTANGSQLELYFDGNKVLEAQDFALQTGHAGILTRSQRDAIDNFNLTTYVEAPRITSSLYTSSSNYTLTGTKKAGASVWMNGFEIVPADSETTWSHNLVFSTEAHHNYSLISKYSDGRESSPMNIVLTYDNTAPTGTMMVNGEINEYSYIFAHEPSLNLTLNVEDNLSGSGIHDMRFAMLGMTSSYGFDESGNLFWSPWEKFSTNKILTLPQDDIWMLMVEFRDYAGLSGIAQSYVLLDTNPPTGTVDINQGAGYTTNRSVNLALTAGDNLFGAEFLQGMRFSTDEGLTWTEWEPVASSKSLTLPQGDGLKEVQYQLKDFSGLVSTFTDTILLDTKPPGGSFIINYGSSYTRSLLVDLIIQAWDSVSNISQMKFSVDGGTTWTTWETFQTIKNLSLPSGDGIKEIKVKIKDAAGFVATLSNAVVLDTQAPQGNILIENGNAFANQSEVILNLSALDSLSGVEAMSFSEDGIHWTAPEAFSETKNWNLSDGDGLKTVYVKFYDAVGNSTAYSDSIEFVPYRFQNVQITPTFRIYAIGQTIYVNYENMPPGTQVKIMSNYSEWREHWTYVLDGTGQQSWTHTNSAPETAYIFLYDPVTGQQIQCAPMGFRYNPSLGKVTANFSNEGPFFYDVLNYGDTIETLPNSEIFPLQPGDLEPQNLKGLAWFKTIQQAAIQQGLTQNKIIPAMNFVSYDTSVYFYYENFPAGFEVIARPEGGLNSEAVFRSDVVNSSGYMQLEFPNSSQHKFYELIVLDKKTGRQVGPSNLISIQNGNISTPAKISKYHLTDLWYVEGVYQYVLEIFEKNRLETRIQEINQWLLSGQINPEAAQIELNEILKSLKLLDGEIEVFDSENRHFEANLPWEGEEYTASISGVEGEVLPTIQLTERRLVMDIPQDFPQKHFKLTLTVKNGEDTRVYETTVRFLKNPEILETFKNLKSAFDLAQTALDGATPENLAERRARFLDAEDVLSEYAAVEFDMIVPGTVPYARVYIEEISGRNITIKYRSREDQSYFDFGSLGQISVQHPGGVIDGELTFTANQNLTSAYFLTMKTSQNGTVLDQLQFDGSRVLSENYPAWDVPEIGKARKTPIVPEIKIAKLNGPNALVHIQTPADQSYVLISGGGLMGYEKIDHEGGFYGFSTVTIEGGRPSGQYTLYYYEGLYGRLLGTVPVYWNAGTKTLTVVNESDVWDPLGEEIDLDEGAQSIDASIDLSERIAAELLREAELLVELEKAAVEFQKMNLLTTMDISPSNPQLQQLATIQGKVLYWDSDLFISPNDLDDYVYSVYPHLHPDNINAYVDQICADSNGTCHRGNLMDTLVTTRSELFTDHTRNLASYESGMSEIISAGVGIFVKIRQGQNEGPLLTQLQELITYWGQFRYIQEIASIGIHLPSVSAVLDASRKLYYQKWEYLLHNQTVEIENMWQIYWNMQKKQAALDRLNAQGEADPDLRVLTQDCSAETGYENCDLTESEQRRLDRAGRLVAEAFRTAQDPRVRAIIGTRPTTTSERYHYDAEGILNVEMTEEEALAFGEDIEEALLEANGSGGLAGQNLTQVINILRQQLGANTLTNNVISQAEVAYAGIADYLYNSDYSQLSVTQKHQALNSVTAFQWVGNDYEMVSLDIIKNSDQGRSLLSRLFMIETAHAAATPETVTAADAGLYNLREEWGSELNQYLGVGSTILQFTLPQTGVQNMAFAPEDRPWSAILTTIEETYEGDPIDLLNEAQDWYISGSFYPNINDLNLFVRTDTVMGKIFLGLMRELWNNSSETARHDLAVKAEYITGIDQESFLRLNNTNQNSFMRGLVRLFRSAGYGTIFYQEPPVQVTQTRFLEAHTDRDFYANGYIRVNWDLIPAEKKIHHVRIYAVEARNFNNEHEVVVTDAVPEEIQGRTYAYIPVDEIAQNLDPSLGYRFKVVVWFQDADGNPVSDGRVYGYTSEAVTIAWDGSTSIPEGMEIAFNSFEDWWRSFGTSITQDFDKPVDYIAGRTIHGGYDIDGSIGDPISAYVGGTVIEVGNGSGWGNYVLIEDADGNEHRYAHLDVVDTWVEEGIYIHSGNVFAQMGNTGNVYGTPGDHLHYEVKDANNNLVDPAILFDPS